MCENNQDTEPSLVLPNPIRYRGYYYDAETELYYLQSRYYNAQVGRFLNADDRVTIENSLLELNTYIYCTNNPNSYYDPTGHSIAALLGLSSVAYIAIKTIVEVTSLLLVGTLAGVATVGISNAIQERSRTQEQVAAYKTGDGSMSRSI